MALQHLREGDATGAAASFEAAAEHGRRCGDPDLAVLGMLGRGQALIRQMRITEGIPFLDEAMVAVETDEVSPVVIGIVYCGVIESCRNVFDVQRARAWTAVLSHWCDTQPDLVPFRGECLVRRAELMQMQGAWDDALEELDRASRVRAERGSGSIMGQALYATAEVLRLRGQLAEAEDTYREANRFGHTPQPGLALLHLAQGDTSVAVESIVRFSDEVQDASGRAVLLPAYVDIMLAAGDVPRAEQAADELSKLAARFGSPYLTAVAERTRGAVLLVSGNPHNALETLHAAWHRLRELDTPYEAARVRLLIARVKRSMGDGDGAEMEIDAVQWIAQQLGATFGEHLTSAMNRSARVDHGLTPRELEVLHLLAGGKTNRDIASALIISERTVDRHVSNILGKLGVPSRTAATAYAYEHHLI